MDLIFGQWKVTEDISKARQTVRAEWSVLLSRDCTYREW